VYDAVTAPSDIDLSSCTSLRSLHLQSIPLGYGVYPPASIKGAIRDTLNHIESYEIRELLFGLYPNPSSDFVHVLQELDWDGTAKSLSRPQFANLERVIFRFSVCPQMKEVKWIIKEEYLPAFKRMLRFDIPNTI
jgi:hypothetical protein